jgi:hypothetical protein
VATLRVKRRLGSFTRGLLQVPELKEDLSNGPRALVEQLDPCRRVERHHEVADEGAARLHDRPRHDAPWGPEGCAEELAEGHLDARARLAVPKHTQHDAPKCVALTKQGQG